MAVDTRNKRFGIVHIALPWRSGHFPNPDGTVDQSDRQQFLGYYPGISWSVLVVTATNLGKSVGFEIFVSGSQVHEIYTAYSSAKEIWAQQ